MNGIERIAAERKRQVEDEGWNVTHDKEHNSGELAKAAACYAMGECPLVFRGYLNGIGFENDPRLHEIWPFKAEWWKPSPENRIRELEKAGALIAAEIDRINANN